MRLKKIKFTNYGVLENKEFEFKENPFLFVAPNESGKTTLVQGIIDAFKLSPEKLKARTTKGKDIYPVIALEFEMKGVDYELKVNAQEKRTSLRGKDGIELSSPISIKNFFEKKGYSFISSVVENLLVIREKEISRTDVRSELKKLFDSVLGLETIRKVKSWLDEKFLRKQEGGYFLKTTLLGEKEKEIRKELEKVSKELEEKEKELEEYQKHQEQYKKITKTLEEKQKEKERLQDLLEKKKRIFLLAKKEKLEKEINELKFQCEEKKKVEANLRKEIENKKEELEKILQELSESEQKKVRYEEQIKNLPSKRKELKRIEEKIKDFQKIKEFEKELEDFKNISVKELQEAYSCWQSYKKVLENISTGVIRIKEAKETIKILSGKEEKILSVGEEFIFKGKAEIKYKDLAVEVFSTTDLKSIEEKITELKETYGTLENFQKILSISQKREKFLAKYSEEEIEDLQSLIEKKRKLEEEIKNLEKFNEEMQSFEEKIRALKEKKKKLENEIKKLSEEATQIVSEFGKLKGKIEKKEEDKVSFEKELKEMMFALDEIEKAKEEAENLENLENEVEKLEKEVEKFSKEIESLREEKSLYEGMLKKVPEEEKIETFYLEKKELEEKLSKLERIREVLFYSKEIISDLSQKLQEGWLREFEKNTSAYFEKITGGRYKKVRFASENLFFGSDEFEKNWEAEREDKEIFPIDSLSDGTKVQLLLSARLALIQCFYPTKAFLIFDEPFAYFDENREKNTLEILNYLANDGWQIILLRCKK